VADRDLRTPTLEQLNGPQPAVDGLPGEAADVDRVPDLNGHQVLANFERP
jgi:hypothetical protein